MIASVRHQMMSVHDVALHVVEAGVADGPPVMLLHGFPECWLSWRPLVAPLSDAGFRLLIPDQRGYNQSDKPSRVRDYALDVLAQDVLGLIDAAGCAKVSLVGHDWGGVVAWWVAQEFPARVERLAVVNAPHPLVFRPYLLSHPAQLVRSWYTFFFQLPWLPEALLRRGNWHGLTRALERTSRPGTFSNETLQEYRAAWSQPGAISAMIRWYRAAFRYPPAPRADVRVRVPVLVMWGTRDAFLSPGLARASCARCDEARLEWIDGATHWVHHEEPERVARLLSGFLGPP